MSDKLTDEELALIREHPLGNAALNSIANTKLTDAALAEIVQRSAYNRRPPDEKGPPISNHTAWAYNAVREDREKLLNHIAALTKDRDEAQCEAFKWNACCASLRASAMKYVKQKFTTANAGDAERELLETASLFYKDAGQSLIDRLNTAEASLEAIKGRLTEDELIAVYNEAYVDSMGHDTQIVQAIRAHVLGEKS